MSAPRANSVHHLDRARSGGASARRRALAKSLCDKQYGVTLSAPLVQVAEAVPHGDDASPRGLPGLTSSIHRNLLP